MGLRATWAQVYIQLLQGLHHALLLANASSDDLDDLFSFL